MGKEIVEYVGKHGVRYRVSPARGRVVFPFLSRQIRWWLSQQPKYARRSVDYAVAAFDGVCKTAGTVVLWAGATLLWAVATGVRAVCGVGLLAARLVGVGKRGR